MGKCWGGSEGLQGLGFRGFGVKGFRVQGFRVWGSGRLQFRFLGFSLGFGGLIGRQLWRFEVPGKMRQFVVLRN